MTEQDQKDLANGKYNRIMSEVISLKEKRNKLIEATCDRLRSIVESDSSSVNEFDPSGIEHPMTMLHETHKKLIERVNALNECAESAGKPRFRISYATFRRHSFDNLKAAMVNFDKTTLFTSDWFIAECLKIAAEYIEILDRGPYGFRMSNELYLKPGRCKDGNYEVSLKKFNGTTLEPYPIAQAAHEYGAHGFARILCETLDKMTEDYATIIKNDRHITSDMKIRLNKATGGIHKTVAHAPVD